MTGSVRAKAATSQAVPEPHPVDSRDISEHNKRQYDEIYWRYGYSIAGEFAMVEEYVRVEDRARQLAQEHAKAARQKLMRMGIRAEVSGWVQKWTVEKVQCYSSHEAVAL